MNKISDFPSATNTSDSDLVYLVQSGSTSKVSKKISLGLLFSKVFSKIVLPKGINYGTPKPLINGDTIDKTAGINRLTVTAAGTSFNLPDGENGDEVILLVPVVPSATFTTTIVGTFSFGASLVLSTGSTYRMICDSGIWYTI